MKNKKIKDFTPEEKRAYDRERKQAQREREKQKSEKYLDELEEKEEREIYKTRSLCFFGEQSPGIDARSHDAELQIHREFLRALDQLDVQPGETLRQVAKRCWTAWLSQATSWTFNGKELVPNPPNEFLAGFNRSAQKFDGYFGFDGSHWRNETFENIWRPPKGCSGDEQIDISTLPELPYRQPKSELKQPEQV